MKVVVCMRHSQVSNWWSAPRWSVVSAVVHYSPSATSEADVQAANCSWWCRCWL